MLLLTCQYFTSQTSHQSQLGPPPGQAMGAVSGGVGVGGMPTQAQLQN